jgi:hypothetical protein
MHLLGQRSSLFFIRTERRHGDCSIPSLETVNGNPALYTGNDGADLSSAEAYAETTKLEQCRRLETTRAVAKTGSSAPSRPCCPPGEPADP